MVYILYVDSNDALLSCGSFFTISYTFFCLYHVLTQADCNINLNIHICWYLIKFI